MASTVGPRIPLHQVKGGVHDNGFDCELNHEVMQPSSQRKPFLRCAVAVALGTAAGIMGFFVLGPLAGKQITADSTISFDLACIKEYLSAHNGKPSLTMVTDCEMKNRYGGHGIGKAVAKNIELGMRPGPGMSMGGLRAQPSQVMPWSMNRPVPGGNTPSRRIPSGAITMRSSDTSTAKMDTKRAKNEAAEGIEATDAANSKIKVKASLTDRTGNLLPIDAETYGTDVLQVVQAQMPDILARDPNWELFAEDFTFIDQAGVKVKGLGPVKIMLKVLQEFHDKLVNTMALKNNLKVETEKISMTDLNGVIRTGLMARWSFEVEKDLESKSIMKSVKIPFVPEDGGLPLKVSGTSTLLVNGDGKVESMTIDSMSINKELSFPQWAMVDMKGLRGNANKAVSILLACLLAAGPMDPAHAARMSGGRVGGRAPMMRSAPMRSAPMRSAPMRSAPSYRTNVYMAPSVVGGYGYGGGFGYGGYGGGFGGPGVGTYLGISLVESLFRAQERQAYLQQQLRTQEQLGKDQAQIAQIQAELAKQNAVVDGLKGQQGAAQNAGQLPATESEEMKMLISQLRAQQVEIDQLKADKAAAKR